MFMPEDVLTAKQAVVTVHADRICLGYVTVRSGTPVTFANQTPETVTVSVVASHPSTAASQTPLASTRLAAGARWKWTPPSAGSRYYTVSNLTGFVGTIDAKPA